MVRSDPNMPAPQAAMLENLVKSLIQAEQHEVPVQYGGDDNFEYNKDFDEYKSKVANPTNLLKAPGMDTITVDSADEISKELADAINDQINYELYSGYIYLSMAAWFEE